jgi:hypothetical protein
LETDLQKRQSNKAIILVAAGAGCCFILVVITAVFFGGAFLFGVTPLLSTQDEVVETTSPSPEQIAHCRTIFAILDDVSVDVERYFFRPGFQDDYLECDMRVTAVSPQDIFDLSVVDPTIEGQQEIAPGRFMTLTIEEPEPGVFHIYGTWFEI